MRLLIPTMSYDVLDENPTFPEYELDDAPMRKLDYLGYAPCPIRHEMQRRLNLFLRQNEPEFGTLEWFSPRGCGEGNDPYDLVWKTASVKITNTAPSAKSKSPFKLP